MNKEKPNFPETPRSLEEIKAEAQLLLDELRSTETLNKEKDETRVRLKELSEEVYRLHMKMGSETLESTLITDLRDRIEEALSPEKK